ncbi:Alpha-ketoglutarate-dependent dioxygenase abh1 [Pyrenophora seminiperda CCB06]|uniref:Alpha-ketoglutarate-dependent dioxygenase abh1 n=1 Tax=Pyrenophora seminiperda CCB06 TaxID=1302712 RepID=A0A3M7M2I4_9PLEO|nr:Alpha-ketoglutarate-dependent dioxygenase abh1 [Pyrenophora seminiperda CCB06]
MHHLDPHVRPPEGIRKVYKKYQKMSPEQLNQDTDILDLSSPAAALLNKKVRLVKQYATEELTATFRTFAGDEDTVTQEEDLDLSSSSRPVYEHEDMPGRNFFCIAFEEF